MKMLIKLLFFVFLYANFLTSKEEPKRFSNLSIRDGLSQNTVSTIMQDNQGFLWFGTEDGLNRFDGIKFRIFKNNNADTNSIADNFITRLFVDSQSRIWVGTNQAGVHLFNPLTESFTSYNSNNFPAAFINNNIRCIYESKDGQLIFGTDNGIVIYDTQNNLFRNFMARPGKYNAKSMIIRDVLEIRSHTFYVATEIGLYLLNTESGKVTPLSDTELQCTSIVEGPDKNLWLGTFHGLQKFNPTSRSFIDFAHTELSTQLKSTYIYDIMLDSGGKFWIATVNGLVSYSIKEDAFNFALHNQEVLSVFEDKTGIIWVGLKTGGVNYWDRNSKPFNHVTQQIGNENSLSSPTIRSIYEDRLGAIWIGSQNGMINRIDPSKSKITKIDLNRRDKVPDPITGITSFMEDEKGNLWIGTWGAGLYKIKQDSKTYNTLFADNYETIIEQFVHDDEDKKSISNNVIQTIILDNQNNLWIGSDNGVDIYDSQNNIFYNINTQNGLSDNRIQSNCIVQDKNGIFWIGSWAGLSIIEFEKPDSIIACIKNKRFKINQITNKAEAHALSDNRIISLHYDQLLNPNTLWLGTYGGGINGIKFTTKNGHININKIIRYTEIDGLANNIVYTILNDSKSNLWLSTNNGLCRFNPIKNEFKNYFFSDGLQSNQFYWGAGYKNKQGLLFFGGINGFNSFDPLKIKDNKFIPEVVFTDLKLANKTISVGNEYDKRIILEKAINFSEEVSLSYQDKVFSIEFAALHYASPKNNKYAYKLEGFDTEWTYSDRYFVTYTNIPPGDYTFHVKASNNDGLWNENGSSLRILIAPPFYLTTWFKIMIIFSFLTLGPALFLLRTRSIRKQNLLLEEKVKLKTKSLTEINEKLNAAKNDLSKEKVRLAKAHKETDQILSSLVSILLVMDENENVIRINKYAEKIFGIKEKKIIGKSILQTGISWDWEKIVSAIEKCRVKKDTVVLNDIAYETADQKKGFLNINVSPFHNSTAIYPGFLILAMDNTERNLLESQLAQSQKLESIGQLAAGIAHEINTPTQFVGDNTHFLKDAFEDIKSLLNHFIRVKVKISTGDNVDLDIKDIDALIDEIDLQYLQEEIPNAIEQSIEGITRVSKLVRAMKEFSHPGVKEKIAINLNQAIRNTITVSRNEWKYIADMEEDFDDELPDVACIPDEFNQVILNLIINGAHAVADKLKVTNEEKGLLKISTRHLGEHVEIRVVDSGSGIPDEIKNRIFDPFFTTKEIGKGTGQGLAISHNVITQKHNGSIKFESEKDKGTTFVIELPLN